MESSVKVTLGKEQQILPFPKVGQLIDIEAMKITLSGGQYGAMIRSGLVKTNYALDLIDAIATLSILIPDLRKKIEVDNVLDMDVKEANVLIKAYKQYNKWFQPIMKELSLDEDETDQKE